MPTFSCSIVQIEKIEKHPNADTLSITEIEGCPVIFRTQDFKIGDFAVYLPIESMIPENKEWVKKFCSHLKFKRGFHRLKAVRLRGIFSMGMLVPMAAITLRDQMDFAMSQPHDGVPPPPDLSLGVNVAEILGVTKWEEPDDQSFEQSAPKPRKPVGFWDHVRFLVYKIFRIKDYPRKIARPMPVYEADHFRKNHHVLEEGEEIVATEKIHGTNFAVGHHKKRFWVSSHRVLRPSEDNTFYWRAVRKYDLKDKLKPYPDLIFYGEVFGPEVQDMGYGVQFGHVNLAFFDIYNVKTGQYLGYDEFRRICAEASLPVAPVVYRGPYKREIIESIKDGDSLVAAGYDFKQFREGVVVRPIVERFDRRCGRVSLKHVGEVYLLRKDGKEGH